MQGAVDAVVAGVDLTPALAGIGAVAAAAIVLTGALFAIRKIRQALNG